MTDDEFRAAIRAVAESIINATIAVARVEVTPEMQRRFDTVLDQLFATPPYGIKRDHAINE
jgi:predicted RNA methylase